MRKQSARTNTPELSSQSVLAYTVRERTEQVKKLFSWNITHMYFSSLVLHSYFFKLGSSLSDTHAHIFITHRALIIVKKWAWALDDALHQNNSIVLIHSRITESLHCIFLNNKYLSVRYLFQGQHVLTNKMFDSAFVNPRHIFWPCKCFTMRLFIKRTRIWAT